MRKIVIATILVSAFASGCMGQKHAGNPDLLKFLTDGQTARYEVLLQLGQPSAFFESERILTYKIGGDVQEGYFIREAEASWARTNFSLVLVFGSDGILISHSLVRVR